MSCVVCGKSCEKTCQKCYMVFYCGKECQLKDWQQIHAREDNDDEDELSNKIFTLGKHPSLYLGGLASLNDVRKYGAIVSCLPRDRFSDVAWKRKIGSASIATLRVDIHDVEDAPIEDYFDQTQRFIDYHLRVKKHNVLVHCAAGISRSASIVINYMMYAKLAKSVDEALEMIREKRNQVNPNKGFLQKLYDRWDRE